MHFLITAGGTREYIDPVRFISNASSGRTGYALARAALRRGHKVTLITAPTILRPPSGAKALCAETAAEMFEAVKRYFDRCDCLIMAAAVGDYTPAQTAGRKIRKTPNVLTLKLKPTVDILRWAGTHRKKGQLVIGFALEDSDVRAGAERKMKDKNLDMVVANTPAAIGSAQTSVEVKTAGGDWLRIRRTSKAVVAAKIISLAESLM